MVPEERRPTTRTVKMLLQQSGGAVTLDVLHPGYIQLHQQLEQMVRSGIVQKQTVQASVTRYVLRERVYATTRQQPSDMNGRIAL